MAAKKFRHFVSVTPGAVTLTLAQIRVAANQRVKLLAIDFMPKGSSPATAPLEFEVDLQAADGTLTSADTAVQEVPTPPGSLLATVHSVCTVEPTTSTKYEKITVHQQARYRWTPPNDDGYLILDQSTRWGIRSIGSVANAVPIDLEISYEE